MVLLGTIFCTTRETREYYNSGVHVTCNRSKGEMLMTGYAFNKREKNSGAVKSRVSGPVPECPKNPDTPGKCPDSPGFSTAAEKQTTHSFAIYHKLSLADKKQ
jgi:hypothetical protein